MADHTRLNPDRRIERLETFNRRLQTSPESTEVFKTWQMELDRRLIELPGRLLPQEMIFFSTTAKYLYLLTFQDVGLGGSLRFAI